MDSLQNITEDEAELYDRQIRLWGLDAQKRLRAARVLLIGVSGLGAEVAKNIVLSGIKSLTLLDSSKVTSEDFANQFLVSREDLGKNRAESSQARTQQLNPMVEVRADSEDIDSKPDIFLQEFDIVCATCCTQEQLVRLNNICHQNNIMFYAGDVFGFYGYMFADLGEHEYAEEQLKKVKPQESGETGEPMTKKAKTDVMETVTQKKTCTFSRFKMALDVDWSSDEMQKKIKRTPDTYFITRVLLEFRSKHGRDPNSENAESDRTELDTLGEEILNKMKVKPDLLQADFNMYCFGEVSPVCAVVGGVLGQEIIKAVSKKDAPHNNFFFYNSVSGSGMVDRIG